jgi:hypothetical protein
MMIKKNDVREHALGCLWALTSEARFTWRFWSCCQKERASKSGHHHAEKLCIWNVDGYVMGRTEHSYATSRPCGQSVADKERTGHPRIELIVRAEEAKFRKKAYLQTEKGKAVKKNGDTRYANSDKGKANAAAYLETDWGKVAKKTSGENYRNSDKSKTNRKGFYHNLTGKASQEAANKKYRATEKGKTAAKATQNAFRERKKAKKAQEAMNA